jgi:hypothetical protein
MDIGRLLLYVSHRSLGEISRIFTTVNDSYKYFVDGRPRRSIGSYAGREPVASAPHGVPLTKWELDDASCAGTGTGSNRRIRGLEISEGQTPRGASICSMSLRVRRNGVSVLSTLRRVTGRNGLPSQARLHSTCSALTSATAASARHCTPSPALLRPQLRVLRTSSHTKDVQSSASAALPVNWATTVHRMRHISPSAMTTQTQTRSHAGHAHHHHHDNTFLLSKNKNDAGVRITRIGLYVNLGMAVSKGFGGYVFNSQGKARQPIRDSRLAKQRQPFSPMPSTASRISSATSSPSQLSAGR